MCLQGACCATRYHSPWSGARLSCDRSRRASGASCPHRVSRRILGHRGTRLQAPASSGGRHRSPGVHAAGQMPRRRLSGAGPGQKPPPDPANPIWASSTRGMRLARTRPAGSRGIMGRQTGRAANQRAAGKPERKGRRCRTKRREYRCGGSAKNNKGARWRLVLMVATFLRFQFVASHA